MWHLAEPLGEPRMRTPGRKELTRLSGVAAVAGVVLALLAASPATAAGATHASPAGAPSATSLSTTEQGCYEFNEIARVPYSNIRAAVPQRYTPHPGITDPSVGFVVFVDNACDTITVDGRRWPRRSVTTMGVTPLDARDGQRGFAYYVLWYGTNNPFLAGKLRSLGVPAHKIAAYDVMTRTDATHTAITMVYRGARLDHVRTAVVVEPPAQPVTEVSSATFYIAGRRGEVALSYANQFRPISTATTEVRVNPDSLLARLGIPSTITGPTSFTRGDWIGTAALH
jgi:hypothetical protein